MKGDVWTFTVASPLLLEDFESYADSPSLKATWPEMGGAWVNLSTANYHGGAKSIEINYYNLGQFTYSESGRTLSPPQDWLGYGAKSMELYFGGPSANNPDTLYLAVEDSLGAQSVVVYPGSPSDIAATEWLPWHVDLQEFSGIDLGAVAGIYVGVGDRDGVTPSETTGYLYVDDISLYTSRCLPGIAGPGDFNDDCIIDYGDLDYIAGDWLDTELEMLPTVPNPWGLAAHYNFDETGGTTASDSSGLGNHATVDPNGETAWDAAGRFAGCLNFDGTFKVDVPPSVFSAISSAVTISVWVNGDPNVQPDPNWGMIFNGRSPTNDRMLLAHCPTKDGEVMFESGGYKIQRLLWTGADAADWEDAWNHYAFVLDTNQGITQMYLNGMLVDEGSASTPIGGITTFTIGSGLVGSPAVNYPYKGRLDDFRIYNYALSQAEVVFLADLAILSIPLDSPANLVEDGAINGKDFAALAARWMETALWP
jgi:hypothetical protein